MSYCNNGVIRLQLAFEHRENKQILTLSRTLAEFPQSVETAYAAGYRLACVTMVDYTAPDTVDLTEAEMTKLAGYDDKRLQEAITSDKVVSGVLADLTGLGGLVAATADNLRPDNGQ